MELLGQRRRHSPGESILEVARNVTTVFTRGRAKQLEPYLRSELENELGRFKIWAGTLGVFAPGNASADHRLRDDPDVKEVFIQMLDRLRQKIKQAIDPPTLVEEPEESEDGEVSSSSSDSSMAISLDEGSNVDSDNDSVPEDIPSRALADIKDIMTRLYRLSAIVKKPSSSNENVKVANFITKEEETEEMKEFKGSVHWQIHHRHPDASPALLERLVNAAIFRRKKLQYRERHKEKLSQGVDQYLSTDLAVPTLPRGSAIRAMAPQRTTSPFLRGKVGSARGSLNTFQYSATEASSVNRLKFASYPKSVALSGITRSAVARREQLDVPRPPVKEAEQSKEAVCPYCFRIVDKEDMAQARWKRHILRDIEPYVCLFDECEKPDESFATVDDWVSHMQWQHAVVWCCRAPGHEITLYHSKEVFEQHLRSEHENDFNESQFPLIVKKSTQPVSDVFSAFTLASLKEDAGCDTLTACPLCSFTVSESEQEPPSGNLEVVSTAGIASNKIRDHIAAHLEAIALLSLPERDDLDDADTNERESENTKHSLEQMADDLPLATFGDGDEVQESLRDEAVYGESISRDDWMSILRDPRVERTRYLDPTQDPTLREFVKRARRIEMFRMWGIFKVPVIIVQDPEGMEISIDGGDRLFTTDDENKLRKPPTGQDIPSIVVDDP